MLRRTGYTLGLLVLLTLASGWLFGKRRGFDVQHQRGTILLGIDRDGQLVAVVWRGSDLRWSARAVTFDFTVRRGVQHRAKGDSDNVVAVGLPVWLPMGLLGGWMAWRWRRRRTRRGAGFPVAEVSR